MLAILCTSDLSKFKSQLPIPIANAIETELNHLIEMLDFDKESPINFRLDTRGYGISYLEPQESESLLRSLGLASPFSRVEYVEFHEIQETQYFRILMMHDNESFTMVFSLKGTQNLELEEWLWDQAIVREGDPE